MVRNKVDVLKSNDLTNGVDAAAGFYFLHSYQVVTEEDHIVATSHYGETITSIYINLKTIKLYFRTTFYLNTNVS